MVEIHKEVEASVELKGETSECFEFKIKTHQGLLLSALFSVVMDAVKAIK